jgi:hypothetical protein
VPYTSWDIPGSERKRSNGTGEKGEIAGMPSLRG